MTERDRDTSGERRGDYVPDDDELRALLGEDLAGDLDELSDLGMDGHGRLVHMSDWREVRRGAPAAIEPVSALDVAEVLGRRLIYVAGDGTRHNLRAATEVFEDSEGQWVHVVEEWRYFAWLAMPKDQRPEQCPRARVYSLVNLWVDPTS